MATEERYLRIQVLDAAPYTVNGSMLSDFVVPFQCPYSPHKYSLSMRLLSAEILMSFYPINSQTNTLKVLHNSVTKTFSVLPGSYTIQTFGPALGTAFAAEFSLTFDQSTGIYTMAAIDGNDFVVLASTTCFEALGIPENTNVPSSAGMLTMPRLANFFGTRTINVQLPDLKFENWQFSSKPSNSLLCSIPATAGPFQCVFYNGSTTNFSRVLSMNEIANLRVRLLDENMDPIDFGGITPQLTLEVGVRGQA